MELSNVCADDVPDIVIITVNGAELDVLSGMPASLRAVRRLYVKAHARHKDTGEPLNKEVAALLEAAGFETHVTLPSRSVAQEVWGQREGDVYAWRRR